jgi:hypothetical protein
LFRIVIEAKNELVALAPTPVVYVEAVLHKYVTSIPDHDDPSISSKDGDASIIEDTIQAVESIHEKAHCGQDKIWEMCGVCDEWRAADKVCRGIRRLLAYLQDVLWHLTQSYADLACAFVDKDLMYQNDDLSLY